MKSTKIFSLSFTILLISFLGLNNSILHCQTFNIGVRTGFSVPQLSDKGTNEISKGYKSRFAPVFGIYANSEFNSHFGVQLELLYVGQGGKRNEMQPIPAEDLVGVPVPPGMTLYADFENEAVLNYLEIPVLAKYTLHLSDVVNIYGELGPYFGILLNAKTKTNGTSKIYFDKEGNSPLTDQQGNPLPAMNFNNENSITNDINSFNIGLTGGIGLGIKISSVSNLNFDIRGEGGFSTIQKNTINGESTTGALMVTAGYSVHL